MKEKRFEHILLQLEKDEITSYDTLAVDLQVSEDTIRRDIDYLHKNGLLSKVRGGAMQRKRNPLTFDDRNTYMSHEKDIIAKKALMFIKEGSTVFMDGGTTHCILASYFPTDIKFRLITNNVPLISQLANFKNIELIGLGGLFDYQTKTFTGKTASEQASKYIADVYFMGVCGVDAEFGITAAVLTDSEVKQAMVKASRRTIAMANHETLRRLDSFKVCGLSDINVLITDLNADNTELNDFRDLDLQII